MSKPKTPTLPLPVMWLCLFCVLSIFTGLAIQQPLKIDGFTILFPVSFLVAFFISVFYAKIPAYFIFYVISAYFIIVSSSAGVISTENLLRESAQSAQMVVLAGVIAMWHPSFDLQKLGRATLYTCAVAVIFSAVWHILNGYYVGHKQLGDVKLAYSYLTLVLFPFVIFDQRRVTGSKIAILLLFSVLLLLSGERKAQASFAAAVVISSLYGFIKMRTLATVIIFCSIPLAFLITSNEYLLRQFDYFIYGVDFAHMTLGDLTHPLSNMAPSDVQREFANRISWELFINNPMLGIGTNAFTPYILTNYSFLPAWMQLGVHGEFQRTMVENGAIALVLYTIPWVHSIYWFVKHRAGLTKYAQASYLIAFVVLLNQCAFEGGGNRAYIAFIIMAFLPAVAATHVKDRIFANPEISK